MKAKKKKSSLEVVKNLKRLIIEIAYKSGEGHIASALSILDILWVLYSKILKYKSSNSHYEKRDYFILSKGHAAIALYVVLNFHGFISKNILDTFGSFNGELGGHPDRNKVPGVEVSTGSLGHGFPMAVGIAKGLKINKLSSKVFVVIGDGESNEGTIWESALLASHHRLNNLCCIIDHNLSNDLALSMGDFVEKFKSFGWNTISIDGHNHNEIYKALSKKPGLKPLLIVAHTIKGKGVKIMENNPAWHHRIPNSEEYKSILKEIS